MQTLKPKWSTDVMTQKFRDAMRRGGGLGEMSDPDARFVSARDASYKDVDRQWWKDFADWKDGRLPAPRVFNFGPASDELKAGGFPEGDIRLTQRVLSSKPDQDNHPFPRTLFFNLPRNLRDPIMVFKSKGNPDARTVLTELKHEGKNLLVAVHFVPIEGGLEISNIASVYPKETGAVLGWIREGLTTYYDKEKAYNWLSHNSAGSNSPQTWVHLQATRNVKTDDDIVKEE